MKRLMASSEKLYLDVYLTNLGKYNEGDLVGKWVHVDGNTDWDEELASIGVSDEPDENGDYYEEYMISDYNTNIPNIADDLGEYPKLSELDEVGEAIQDVDADIFNAIMEDVSNFDETIDILEKGNYTYIPNISTEEELGRYYIDEVDGGEEHISAHTLETYYDYEAMGRDLRLEGFFDELDAENRDDDEEEESQFDNMSDEELGEYAINDLGLEYDTNYFDYEAYGRDINMDGMFCNTGWISTY